MEQLNSLTKLLVGFSGILLISALCSSSYAAGNTFIFNPNTLVWKAVNEHGKVVRTGRGSGGSNYCADVRRGCKTPAGQYRIISKGNAGCRSSRYPLGSYAVLYVF